MGIVVKALGQVPLEEQGVEICERKGLGHPDYICDSLMDAVSVALSREYLRRFGTILHHNIDKGLLVAGEAERRFGGGKVKRPMLLVFGDRATFEARGEIIPVEEIAVATAKEWFRRRLRFVDPEAHVRYQVELKKGSEELTDIFLRRRKREFLGANDTSAAVGYYPLTETERLVKGTEEYLNSGRFKKAFPDSGEDVKVMGLRVGGRLGLTVAMPLIDRYIGSEREYFRRKREVLEDLRSHLAGERTMPVDLALNTLDAEGRGMGGIYLTVLGTSAEDADCGQVGRGNRVNGIIPLHRPTSSEAAAGKNPVSHVGKIYNVLTYRMARRVYEDIPGIREVYVWLLSQIGVPIDRPQVAAAQLILEKGTRLAEVSRDVEEVIASELEAAHLRRFCRDLAYGRIPIC